VTGRRGQTAPLLAAIGLVVVPAAGLLLLANVEDQLHPVTTEPAPVFVPAVLVETVEGRAISVRLSWDEPPDVIAPPWSGTVTAVGAEPGGELVFGDVVVVVDDVLRLAVTDAGPFWRPLSLGATGRDVADLQSVLGRLDLFEGEPDGVFGVTTRSSVRALAERLGIVRPTETFDPGWFVVLPFEPYLVTSMSLHPGTPVPPQGTQILFPPPLLIRALLFTVGGEPVDLDGGVDYVLEAEGLTIHLAAGAAEVDAEGLALLGMALAPGTETIEGHIQRAEPVSVMQVPATAVMSDRSGRLCVWVMAGPDLRSTPVVVQSATVGVVRVHGDLDSEAAVLANPGEFLHDPTCP
jgi:peptidoglycan hydrolase-like protein with peptidoglycan-binding domain